MQFVSTNRNRGRVLIAEPDGLLRWSLAQYLGKWFDVVEADSAEAALAVMQDQPVQALVVAEDLALECSNRLESYALARNANVITMRTGALSTPDDPPRARLLSVEKPFDLSQVAAMLGVEVKTSGRSEKV